MDPELKKELKQKILEKVEDFKLQDVIQHAFVRQYDSKTQLSSHDMAYAVASLLEHPNISGDLSTENKNPNGAKKTSLLTTRDQLNDNFWVAYDALELNSHSKLGLIYKGIE